MASTITSISLPPALRRRLDHEAARQRRSRSFVVAEAVARYLDEADRRGFAEGRERTLREALVRAYGAALLVDWPSKVYRRDIGRSVLEASTSGELRIRPPEP